MATRPNLPDPMPLGQIGPSAFSRLVAGVKNYAASITAGPVDDTLRPDDPGHPEYHHHQRAAFALSRWQTAVPYRYRDATATHPGVTHWADRAAKDIRSAGFLVLTGDLGAGKTHQAYGALRHIAETGPQRFEMVATTAPDLYGLLRPGGSDKGSEYELRQLCRVPLLMLDDLGTEKLSEFTEEATYRILNERYNECRPLLITTNLPVRAAVGSDGSPLGPDLIGRLGDRLASRLAQTATVITFTGPNLRRQHRDAR